MRIVDRLNNFLRPVLSDRTIMEMNAKGLLIETPIKPAQLQPNSVDLTLGATWKKVRPNDKICMRDSINPAKETVYEEGYFKPLIIDGKESRPAYLLEPGEFILMASHEILHIPNGILAFVQGRSSIARIGIQTEEAGLIDAGFRGTITFEVYNETKYPIPLFEGMRVAQLYFYKAQKALHPYGSKGKGSKYQSQIEATGSRIYKDPEFHK